MRPVIGVMCLLALVPVSARGEQLSAQWPRVRDRHGSSVEVPISILKAKPSDLGLLFVADNGSTTITFSSVTEARAGFPGHDPEGDIDRSDCPRWPPSHYRVKDDTAAYSCRKRDRIIYYVARYTPSGSATLRAEYPEASRQFWDGAVTRMAASMRQVARSELR